MIKELKRDVRQLRQATEILRKGKTLKAPLVQVQWRALILLRQNSTARSSHDRIY